MTRGPTLAALALLFAGCQAPLMDDFQSAERMLREGDLLGTLSRLDRVPPSDPRYPHSRSMANAVERRVRLGQRLIAEGMQLRAEWRDQEAAECFVRALEIWPELRAAQVLLEATRFRIDSFERDEPAAANRVVGEVVETMPVRVPVEVESAPVRQYPARPSVEPAPRIANPRDVEQCIEAVRSRLDEGLLEAALAVAESAGGRLPQCDVRDRLVATLHQRALVHYGHGALQLALSDWLRLQAIDPSHAESAEFAAAARAEIALR